MMGRDGADQALHGYDGRVVYADTFTVRLYELLRTDVRAEVREMLRTQWSGSRDLSPDDLLHPEGIAAATIRISDCVARCRVEIGAHLPQGDRVVVENNEIRVGQRVPDTLVATLRGMDAGDVFGHPFLRGVRITHVRREADPLTLLWNDPTRYIVDGDPDIAEPQLACGALA